MNPPAAFLYASCLAAAIAPLLSSPAPPPRPPTLTWPTQRAGLPLTPLPLDLLEAQTHARFPGAVALFTDGQRRYLYRWVTQPTRQLHSSADCFRGLGYQVQLTAPILDEHGARWSRFWAQRHGQLLEIREQITTLDGQSTWTDVSAWYWTTLWHSHPGPWLGVSIIEDH